MCTKAIGQNYNARYKELLWDRYLQNFSWTAHTQSSVWLKKQQQQQKLFMWETLCFAASWGKTDVGKRATGSWGSVDPCQQLPELRVFQTGSTITSRQTGSYMRSGKEKGILILLTWQRCMGADKEWRERDNERKQWKYQQQSWVQRSIGFMARWRWQSMMSTVGTRSTMTMVQFFTTRSLI